METTTKKNVKRFLQCRLRYSYRFPARGEQRKVRGVLEEIKDEEGAVERLLPAVELPKKEGLASVTIGPFTDDQIERLEGNPTRNQLPDPTFKHFRETGQVRWLYAKPSEDKSDREKLEDAKAENAKLRARILELEGKMPVQTSANPHNQAAKGERLAALEAARLRQKQGLELSAEDRALLASVDDFGVTRL